MVDFMPPDSAGAEFGGFAGLFSAILARERKISRVIFVASWYEILEYYSGTSGKNIAAIYSLTLPYPE
jgi:hypothetical protein